MQYLHRLASRAECLAFLPDGSGLFTGGTYESAVRLWDLATGKLRSSRSSAHSRVGVSGVAVSPDGAWLAVGYRLKGQVAVWNLAGGPPRLIEGLLGELSHDRMAFSSDGRTLAGSTTA